MPELVTLGETMVVLNPVFRGPLSAVTFFRKSIGGAESNVAIGASRLGISAGWISRLGDDELGKFVLRTIRGEGVDTSQVIMDPRSRTGLFVKEIKGSQDPGVYYYRAGSAASLMRPEDLNPGYISSAKILHVTGITPALSNSCRETVLEAIRIAKSAHVMVSFDPNIRLKLWTIEEARPVLMEIARKADFLFPGLDEARMLLNDYRLEAREAAFRLHEMCGARTIAIKMGAQGAYLLCDGQEYFQHAFEVAVVDSIGAGDAFVGAFLASWLKGKSVQEALAAGAAAGALAVTTEGDYEALPETAQLDAFLAGRRAISR